MNSKAEPLNMSICLKNTLLLCSSLTVNISENYSLLIEDILDSITYICLFPDFKDAL